MMRKTGLFIVGLLVGVSAGLGATTLVTQMATAKAAGADTYRQLALFGDVFERVRSIYVTEPNEEELVENAINGMLASLDPHSSYLNPKDFSDMRVQTRGEFGGLGIEVTMENELVKVISPIEGTPASEAGVLAGDLIYQIDGEAVRGLTLQQAVEKMRGPVNTPIELKIQREGADGPITITVIRDIIKVRSVRWRVERDTIGYIDINSFTEQTDSGLEDAIEKIKAQVGADKVTGYVIDLRLNPGGLLDQAVNVSDAFLDRGEIVSTRGRDENDVTRYQARPGDLVEGKPIIVLVNGGSASASEIVAGALQDHKRATVLGTRSFGKGSVQTIIQLGGNGALRLTTALYYTPSNTSIQAKGIEPDIRVVQPLPDELKGRVESAGESKLRGHITGDLEDDEGSGSSAYVPPDPEDDIQLNYALDLIAGAKTAEGKFPPDPSKALPN
ncbi:MAG: S41 family peptidase [Phyllobacteriaceae bacterium]|nr:S41 family peptidase [Nitratireductor sp.]MCO5133193.1 S41 family peptidase [Phyllobacteriaceae bacterium]